MYYIYLNSPLLWNIMWNSSIAISAMWRLTASIEWAKTIFSIYTHEILWCTINQFGEVLFSSIIHQTIEILSGTRSWANVSGVHAFLAQWFYLGFHLGDCWKGNKYEPVFIHQGWYLKTDTFTGWRWLDYKAVLSHWKSFYCLHLKWLKIGDAQLIEWHTLAIKFPPYRSVSFRKRS